MKLSGAGASWVEHLVLTKPVSSGPVCLRGKVALPTYHTEPVVHFHSFLFHSQWWQWQ